MRTFAILDFSQRLILATMSYWFFWSLIVSIDAPYNPSGFLLTMFGCSLIMAYLTCIWVVAPITPSGFWLPWKVLLQCLIACAPFFLIVIFGHYIVVTVKLWLTS